MDIGYENVYGADYSPTAIALCRRLALECDRNADAFFVADILAEDLSLSTHYDYLVDKGTLDAISLMPANTGDDGYDDSVSQRDKKAADRYIESVKRLLAADGPRLILITSCNWTECELVAMFTAHGSRIYKREIILPYVQDFECIQPSNTRRFPLADSRVKPPAPSPFNCRRRRHHRAAVSIECAMYFTRWILSIECDGLI
jgi:hypothetical protein